ncbi:MAG: NAD(P)H-hydrate dehydratase [Bacteroidota bacterium]|nr:NAD(P)H-hydrate dehydratase [Bacteroidota bacterium]
MKTLLPVLSAAQIRKADLATIARQKISSYALMERAGLSCCEWIKKKYSTQHPVCLFAGQGNNGGDGLVIARLLLEAGYPVTVYQTQLSANYSEDCLKAREVLLQAHAAAFHVIKTPRKLPQMTADTICIDALLGTGLTRPLTGNLAAMIQELNASAAIKISIDLPTGLLADADSGKDAVIFQADHTLSFQFPKLSFLFPDSGACTGQWWVMDIGLDEGFIQKEPTPNHVITQGYIQALIKPRKKFSHKGTYGHALLISGSLGKMGAAILAAKACLRSGAGLVNVHLPQSGNVIMQTALPEVMTSPDAHSDIITGIPSSLNYTSLGIGPGIGTSEPTANCLIQILQQAKKPMVLDADALNILGMHPEWLSWVPAGSILTPHPKEFERIAGKSANDFDRHQQQLALSKQYRVNIILKGAHTCITTPEGQSYFNNTGNPGMAKGGSGDVLTGILTALLAQGYPSLETCLIGVCIHGYAGDLAKNKKGETGMIASDICDALPQAFDTFCKKNSESG